MVSKKVIDPFFCVAVKLFVIALKNKLVWIEVHLG